MVLVEEWISKIIREKIYGKGHKIQQDIASCPLKNQNDSRYIEIADVLKRYISPQAEKAFLNSVYTTVEESDNEVKSIKLWFDKEKDELKQIGNIEEEYDSSREMWTFYDKVYQSVFSTINEVSMTTENYVRYYKKLNDITFAGEVDFNFSKDGKNSKVGYLNETVNNDPLFCDNKEKSEEEKLKKEILDLIEAASKHHHSVENVSMMASTGKMQITKQNIGNDRFDVFVYAIDEYCKGNTAWLLAHCTPENKAALCKFLEMICSKDGKLCSDEYYSKIYKITDKTLIDDLKRSGKLSIDSAQRVLEYVSLAYRVWIHRAKHYEKKYKTKYEELNGFSSEKLIEEYKAVVGVMQEL